jgi:hypothetical protein
MIVPQEMHPTYFHTYEHSAIQKITNSNLAKMEHMLMKQFTLCKCNRADFERNHSETKGDSPAAFWKER